MAVTSRARATGTKRERSRQRLLDAAIDCLSELGYARSTAAAITKKAGLSHGSLFDHFGTKDDLFVAATQRVLVRTMQELGAELLADVPASDRPIESAIEVTWRLYHTPPADALIELHVASRTHPDLARAMQDAEPEFRRRIEVFMTLLFPELAGNPVLPAVARLTHATQLGLVMIERSFGGGPDVDACLALLVEQVQHLLDQRRQVVL
jgi:AcrR family transcriptional regulator